MARISPVPVHRLTPEVRTAFFNHVAEYKGRITNMKATLGHSLPAFQAYAQWYPLYENVQRILGPRLASFYAFAISEAAECIWCSLFFRKIIIDGGEEPDALDLTPNEQLLLNFGSLIVHSLGDVPDPIYRQVSALYTEAQLVTLIAFAGQMIAANVFNNVIQTDIDEHLRPYLPLTIVL